MAIDNAAHSQIFGFIGVALYAVDGNAVLPPPRPLPWPPFPWPSPGPEHGRSLSFR